MRELVNIHNYMFLAESAQGANRDPLFSTSDDSDTNLTPIVIEELQFKYSKNRTKLFSFTRLR